MLQDSDSHKGTNVATLLGRPDAGVENEGDGHTATSAPGPTGKFDSENTVWQFWSILITLYPTQHKFYPFQSFSLLYSLSPTRSLSPHQHASAKDGVMSHWTSFGDIWTRFFLWWSWFWI